MSRHICWYDTCTNLRGLSQCPNCGRWVCEDHQDISGLCASCTPVDPREYQAMLQKFGIKFEA